MLGKSVLLLGAVMLLVTQGNAQRSLSRYNVAPNSISTSGVSSGAAMATQFHVAFSARVMGAAILAGGPYYCAQGHLATAAPCLLMPDRVDVDELVDYTHSFASSGLIDQVSNMYDSRVFVLHGLYDKVVDPRMSEHVLTYYTHFLKAGNIKTYFTLPAAHTHPTEDYGNDCLQTRSPFISKCDYAGAYETLNWIYGGNLVKPSSSQPLIGDLYLFDQKEFFGREGPKSASMDDVGYVYVPSGCIDSQKACKLHVAFHGCLQSKEFVDDIYARHSQFSQVGEVNDIIILYPQTIQTLNNPEACWDWWSYTDANYANKKGPQMKATMDMVTRITGPQ